VRILHTSDWHLGRNLEQISRIDEQRQFIDFLSETAQEQEIDLVLVAGDIYDTYNPSAAAEELFYDAIDRLNDGGKRAVLVIAGNHDNPERLCAASPLASRRGIILLGYPSSDAGNPSSDAGNPASDPGVNSSPANANNDNAGESIHAVDSGPGWLELHIPGCDHNAVIITMPYPSESRLEELLSAQADENALQKAYSDRIGSIFSTLSDKFREDTVNLIVAHMFMLGGSTSDSERTLQVGGAMTVSPDIMPEKTHYAAMGHLHRPQEIRNAPCPVFYAGSPLAYSFSEADYSKAIFLVDAMPGEKANVKPIYIDCGKPLRKWYANEGIGQAIKWCEEGRDSNAWVDLEIMTDRVFTSEEQKMLRTLHSGIINIRPRLKTDAAEIINPINREGRRIDELFSDYYKYRMGTQIPDELMEVFLEVVNDDMDADVYEMDEDVYEDADTDTGTRTDTDTGTHTGTGTQIGDNASAYKYNDTRTGVSTSYDTNADDNMEIDADADSSGEGYAEFIEEGGDESETEAS